MVRLLAVLALLAAFLRQDDKAFDEFRRDALKREEEGKWKKIAWQKDMATALEKAKSDNNKPILVVLVVGLRGQKGAAEC